jgi:hypothetical protein
LNIIFLQAPAQITRLRAQPQALINNLLTAPIRRLRVLAA